MDKLKSVEALDRLSELPNSIIFAIFGLMKMKHVVATTILSKRWRNLWTTVPCLNFSAKSSEDSEFITRALMFWRGTEILKLKIELSYELDDFAFSEIDLWLRLAKDYHVQELCVHSMDIDYQAYPVPPYLLTSCSSLILLSLKGCELKIPGNVQWNQLKNLTIHCLNSFTCDEIKRLLLGTPQLEILALRFMESFEDLSIRSTSLKKLSVEKYLLNEKSDPPMDTQLIISAPNLETLEISNVPYYYCSLEDVSSLTDVALLFDDHNNKNCGAGFLEDTLNEILTAIHRVDSVALSDWCIKVLVARRKEHLVSRLWDAKLLKLKSKFVYREEMVTAVDIFSKMEMLVLEDANEYDSSEDGGKYESKDEEVISCLDFQPSLPNLRIVEVRWGERDFSMFSFIEVLLKYASNLEKMVFRVRKKIPLQRPPRFSPPQTVWRLQRLFLASQRLLRMQRSSPSAKLIFCESSFKGIKIFVLEKSAMIGKKVSIITASVPEKVDGICKVNGITA